jgi:membrane protease YdiL (CAAX protease family)
MKIELIQKPRIERIVFVNIANVASQSAPISRSLQQWIHQHPLISYFFLAYAISWILFIPYVLAEWGILSGNYMLFYLLHTFGPAFAAVIITAVIAGKAGVQELRQRIRQRGASWQWYLFLLVGIPALVLLGITLQPGALAHFHDLTPLILVSYPLYYVLTFFGGGPLGEEVGWRGFALPRMQLRYGPLLGTLFLGILWSCWHLPDFLTASKGGGQGTGWTAFLTNFPVFLLAVVSLAIVMTWIFNHTAGSIFTAILAHTSVNILEVVLIPRYLTLDEISLHRALLIGFGVPAILILILTRGRLGYPLKQETGTVIAD